jgi:RNA recognition motif-containing protein
MQTNTDKNRYAIVKLFEPFGKITSIEVMVHWTGPKKGIPRGFCFLEFEKKEVSNAYSVTNQRKCFL